jgi:hypothetical protein
MILRSCHHNHGRLGWHRQAVHGPRHRRFWRRSFVRSF